MCQLFALNSNVPTEVTFSFSGFAARGGVTGEHTDGWGISFHGEQGCRSFHDDEPASRSPLAAFLGRHPIRATTVMAHVRKATRGPVQLSNCHPFQRPWRGRQWLFCHNGTLEGFVPSLDATNQPVGTTDSEHAFCWLLQSLRGCFGDRGPALSWQDLAPAIAALAGEIATHGPFNFLLSDGQTLYAHCSTRLHWLSRRHPFAHARLVDREMSLDLSRVNEATDRMVLLATEPLTHEQSWQPLRPGELLVLQHGTLVSRHLAGRTLTTTS